MSQKPGTRTVPSATNTESSRWAAPWWSCSFDNVTSFSIQVTQYKKSAESKQAQGRRRWITFSILLSSYPVACRLRTLSNPKFLRLDSRRTLCKCEQTKVGGSTRLPAIMAPASSSGLQNGALAAARLVTSFFTADLSCRLRPAG